MDTTHEKLTSGEKHFLRLIDKDADDEGWCKVSKAVMPLVKKMPPRLVIWEDTDEGRGRAKLTDEGAAVLNAMTWL